MKIGHQIPSLYRALMPSGLLSFELKETKATCHDCAMTPEKRGPRAKVTYRQDLKCCTFEPFLPNFVVGALLKSTHDQHQVAKKIIRGRITKQELALPLGVFPSASFQVALNNRGPDEFGNREDWLCSFYDKETQGCGIWRYRGSVCTGFYCKSDAGAKGLRFWDQLATYMHVLEMSLAEELLVQLDFSPRQISENLDYFNLKKLPKNLAKKDSFGSADYKKIWNGYHEEIEFFYLKCYEKALTYDREMIQEILGEEGMMAETQVLRQIQKLG